MPRHYETALRMLGVVENRILGPADHILKRAADAIGVGHTFYRTQVAVFQPPDGEPAGRPTPIRTFGGEGPERTTCIGCGGCMMGCRYQRQEHARQELPLPGREARRAGLRGDRVVDVRPLEGRPDGSDGYEVHTVQSTAWLRQEPRRFTCRGVVFAASALGTHGPALPTQAERLAAAHQRPAGPARAHQCRIADRRARARQPRGPLEGIAIGSGIYLDDHTHIEATRYPAGSDAMGLLATLLTGGRPGCEPHPALAADSGRLAAAPSGSYPAPLHPFGWARESLIFLCMQTLDGHIDMRLGRPWFWPFRKALMSHGQPHPDLIPQANEFARKAARRSAVRR